MGYRIKRLQDFARGVRESKALLERERWPRERLERFQQERLERAGSLRGGALAVLARADPAPARFELDELSR